MREHDEIAKALVDDHLLRYGQFFKRPMIAQISQALNNEWLRSREQALKENDAVIELWKDRLKKAEAEVQRLLEIGERHYAASELHREARQKAEGERDALRIINGICLQEGHEAGLRAAAEEIRPKADKANWGEIEQWRDIYEKRILALIPTKQEPSDVK